MTSKTEVDLFFAEVQAAYQTGAIDQQAAELALTRALVSSILGETKFDALAYEMLPKRPLFLN
jgi:hypothetical protein